MATLEEWQRVWREFDLEARHREFRPVSPEQLAEDGELNGMDLFFVKWHDLQLCCDVMNGWAFSNVNLADDTGNPNSAWKIVTPSFGTLAEALDFPMLDGKSVRERFAECRFFVE